MTAPRGSIELWLGDRDFNKIGEVGSFSSFDAVARRLAPGEFNLVTSRAGIELESGARLDDVQTVLFRGPEGERFGGFVRPVTTGVGGLVERFTAADGYRVTCDGPDEWGLLAERSAFPTPSLSAPPWPDAYDVRYGVVGEIAAAYLDANAGPGAPLERRIAPLLDPVPAAIGPVVTWSARMQPLDVLMTELCSAGNIGCLPRVETVDGDRKVRVKFVPYVDRSGDIVLSTDGDFLEATRVRGICRATFVIGAGQGELTDRQFVTATTGAAGRDRRELVYENTSLTDVSALQLATDQQLADSCVDSAVEAVLSDAGAQRIVWQRDYDLGDRLGVELVAGERLAVRVEAVSISARPGYTTIRPVLGVASVDALQGILDDVARITRRVENEHD